MKKDFADTSAHGSRSYVNQNAEYGVVGSILQDPIKALRVAVNLGMRPEQFYTPVVIKAIELCMTMPPEKIDMISLQHELAKAMNREPADMAMVVDQMYAASQSAAYIERYLAIVQECYEKRRVAEIMGEVYEELPTAQNDVLISETCDKLRKIKRANANPKLGDLMASRMSELALCKTTSRLGLMTQWPEFNRLMGSWPRGHMNILAARPKQGKTTLVVNLASHWLDEGKKGFIASIEMGGGEIFDLIVGHRTGINLESLKAGTMADSALEKYRVAAEKLTKQNLQINDRKQTIHTLKACIRDAVSDGGAEFVIVDYLGLIKMDGKGSRYEQVSLFSNELTALCKDFPEVTFIILHQLSREGVKQGRLRPELQDLRDSGCIEQDAYIVVFLYENPDCEGQDNSEQCGVIVEIAARRGGRTGKVNMLFKKTMQRFDEHQMRDNSPIPTQG